MRSRLTINISQIFKLYVFTYFSVEGKDYYGKVIGNFNNYAHKVSGKVYAVDEDTIFIKGFSYDGLGPGITFLFICLSGFLISRVEELELI
jgi:hypothetical protein